MNRGKLLEVFMFFKKDLKKGGFSTIIAMILIVLVSVGAISVMWLGLYSMINVDISNFDSKLSIVTEGGFTFYDAEDKSVTIQIESTGEDTPAYVQIILIMNDGEELISVHDAPEVNSRKRYYLDVSGYDSYPVSVSIAPIFYVEGQNVLGQKISPVNFPKRVEVSKFYENAGLALMPIFSYVTSLGRGGGVSKFTTDGEVADCFDLSVNPVPICTCNDLQRMNENLDANYELQKHIDCSDTINWNNGEGFEPVGNVVNTFKGSFDGNGYIIDGLYISRRDKDYQGFFGKTQNAELRNFMLIRVNLSGRMYVGGVVGQNFEYSNISNSCVKGDIRGKSSVGGLAGQNFEYSNISVSCFEGFIFASEEGGGGIGGLVGFNYLSSITYSYSDALVNTAGSKVGGLVGSFYYGLINSSFSRGGVIRILEDSLDNYGGFIGEVYQGEIYNSYSTVSVVYLNGENPVDKGFIGIMGSSPSYFGNFFDSELSGQSLGTGATPKTTIEMKTKSTFTDSLWDFDNIWNIDSNINDGYPYLRDIG